MSAKDHLPYDVLDLDGLRDDFAAGRVRQVGVVARRLLATLDAVLSSQGMVRASRPREAGSGAPDEGSKWYTGDGEAFIVLPPNEVRRLRIEAAQSMRAAPVVPITHTVAPEACPVAEKPLAWTAFSESASWTGVWCKTREGAQERVDEFKRRWPKTGPYRVVPLYAHPASATAEGGGEAKAANTNAVARAVGGLLDAWDLSDEDSVVEKVRPHMKAIHRLIERDEFYATPASAAGREGAVEKARRAFYEAARGFGEIVDHLDRVYGNLIGPVFLKTYRALLAAEAEVGGES